MEGDKGYSGLITKNPTHEEWVAWWMTDHLYSLGELEEWLGDFMPPASWRRARRKKPIGLGRNCAIFETARTWAYREIRHHWGDPAGLATAIDLEVHRLNAEFSEPLLINEASQIATSIHRWITTESRMWRDGPVVYEATFSTIQSARGKKSGGVRRARALDRAAVIGED